MNIVTYRNLEKSDYTMVKSLIEDAFRIDNYVKDKSQLKYVLNVYLQECILSSTYSKVAVKDNMVIGIILGSADGDEKVSKLHNKVSYLGSMIKIFFSLLRKKGNVREFSKLTDAYKKIIKGMEDRFQGCIQLLIVSKESRGLGVGKSLLKDLFCYMKSKDVKELYLYTDNSCNYGFYDSQGFAKIAETDTYFDNGSIKLDVYLYGYKL